eukprot:891864-Amphidinium_carterae.1
MPPTNKSQNVKHKGATKQQIMIPRISKSGCYHCCNSKGLVTRSISCTAFVPQVEHTSTATKREMPPSDVLHAKKLLAYD